MWVARFRLRDDDDLFSPLCERFGVEFHAFPYQAFSKAGTVNRFIGGTVSGPTLGKASFLAALGALKGVKLARHGDFVFMHVRMKMSRQAESRLMAFYGASFIRVRPVRVAADGWEYWEVASPERGVLGRLVRVAEEFFHGELYSLRKESLRTVSSLTFAPGLTPSQESAIKLAFSEGYYEYPRRAKLVDLARRSRLSYSAFQEHLSRAEGKLAAYFLTDR